MAPDHGFLLLYYCMLTPAGGMAAFYHADHVGNFIKTANPDVRYSAAPGAGRCLVDASPVMMRPSNVALAATVTKPAVPRFRRELWQ